MVILDTALQKRHDEGNPIRTAIIGAGYMGRGIAVQMAGMKGIELSAISNRTLSKAETAYEDVGIEAMRASTQAQVNDALRAGRPVVTNQPNLVCRAEGIDAILEATGEVEFGAQVVMTAVDQGKHVILMNAELDATVGPLLKRYADRKGVVISNADGDEPGVAMNLLRFVRTIGFEPVMAGNIKGFYDPYRTPETQRAFAEKHGQKPKMITSFADGTKLSMETTVLANATGFKVAKRGMHGPQCDHVEDILDRFAPESFHDRRGIVEYVLGAEPGTGAFVVGHGEHPIKQQYMKYFKMGDGPLYLFYTPFHLPHLQVPLTVARAVLFEDPAVTPLGRPYCDVIAVAKRHLSAGEALDGIGGFTCYGLIENAETSIRNDFLPMGVTNGCTLKNNVEKDEPIRYSDVILPEGRFIDKLREEQTNEFFPQRSSTASA